MSIAYLLVAIGMGVLALAVWALFWAVDSGQFENLESHASDAVEQEAVPGVQNESGVQNASASRR
jgi:cbb3-type cytochrome oxidase maturation protein